MRAADLPALRQRGEIGRIVMIGFPVVYLAAQFAIAALHAGPRCIEQAADGIGAADATAGRGGVVEGHHPPCARRLGLWHSRICRSEEHTSALQSPMRNSSAVFCLKK